MPKVKYVLFKAVNTGNFVVNFNLRDKPPFFKKFILFSFFNNFFFLNQNYFISKCS